MKRTGSIGEDPALISISCAPVVIHTVSWWTALRAILIKKTVGTSLSSSDGSDRFVSEEVHYTIEEGEGIFVQEKRDEGNECQRQNRRIHSDI